MAPPLPLLEALRGDARIREFIKDACFENGIGATISTALSPADYLIIKPDDYYNSFPPEERIKSPDCLVVVRCADGRFRLFVIELRDIASAAGFTLDEIRQKFTNCLGDFMSNVLREHFYRPDVEIRRLDLYFVTDPYGERQGSTTRMSKTTRIDALLAESAGRPFHFGGKRYGLQHRLPDPLIQPC